MKYSRLLGWGIVIYAVMALAWLALLAYGIAGTWGARVLQLLILLITVTIAARSLHLTNWRDMLPYSIGWMLVVIALDGFINVPISGLAVFFNPDVWVGYALVAIVPLITLSANRYRSAPDL